MIIRNNDLPLTQCLPLGNALCNSNNNMIILSTNKNLSTRRYGELLFLFQAILIKQLFMSVISIFVSTNLRFCC